MMKTILDTEAVWQPTNLSLKLSTDVPFRATGDEPDEYVSYIQVEIWTSAITYEIEAGDPEDEEELGLLACDLDSTVKLGYFSFERIHVADCINEGMSVYVVFDNMGTFETLLYGSILMPFEDREEDDPRCDFLANTLGLDDCVHLDDFLILYDWSFTDGDRRNLPLLHEALKYALPRVSCVVVIPPKLTPDLELLGFGYDPESKMFLRYGEGEFDETDLAESRQLWGFDVYGKTDESALPVTQA